MKIKVTHLVELLEYLDREGVLEVDTDLRAMDTGVNFSFHDKEDRACEIVLFQSQMNSAPQLTKIMKLYTREEGRRKKDHVGDALKEKAEKEKK